MTRKHFEATAKIVSRISNLDTRTSVAADFADYFGTENPRFDDNKFFEACGI